MANTFKYIENFVSMECLRILKNSTEIARVFNTEHNKEFSKPFAVGESVDIKLPQRWTIRDGLKYTDQGISRRTTKVTMGAPFGIDFGWDDLEAAIKAERSDAEISKQYLQPAMSQLAQEIDSRAALFAYQNTNNIAGVLGTLPTSTDPYQTAETMLWENSAPASDRVCAVSPAMMQAFVKASAAVFNPSSEISKEFRKGEVGEYANATWVRSMSLYDHVSGVQNAAGVTTLGAMAEGATSIPVTATAGDTYKVGDVLAFNYGLATEIQNANPGTRRGTGRAKTVTVTQDFTAIGGGDAADIVNFWPPLEATGQYRNCSGLPASGAVITMFPGTAGANAGKHGVNGLHFTKDAFALVSTKLDMPANQQPGSFMKHDPKTGIAIRCVKYWDGDTSTMKTRFDVVLGFGKLYSDQCSVRLLSLQ